VPIWTTTPWTLPASVAVTLGPDIDYVLIEGPARSGKRVLLVVAELLLEKIAKRYGFENPVALGHISSLHHPLFCSVSPIWPNGGRLS